VLPGLTPPMLSAFSSSDSSTGDRYWGMTGFLSHAELLTVLQVKKLGYMCAVEAVLFWLVSLSQAVSSQRGVLAAVALRHAVCFLPSTWKTAASGKVSLLSFNGVAVSCCLSLRLQALRGCFAPTYPAACLLV
jgi:hypothetical protein